MRVYLGLRFRLMLVMTILLVVTAIVLYELNRRATVQITHQVEAQTTELTAAVAIGLQSISSPDSLEVICARQLPTGYERIKHILLTDHNGKVTDSMHGRDVNRHIQLPQSPFPLLSGDPLAPFEQPSDHELKEQEQSIFIPFISAGASGSRETNYLVVVMSSHKLSDALSTTARIRLVATVLVLTLGLLVSAELVWRFTSPIGLLVRAAQRVADGDLYFNIGLKRRDEIGQLIVNFDRMIDQLREKRGLEERLHHAERAAVIGRLASGIAHEIRNPLNFINLTIDHVRTKFAPSEEKSRSTFERLLLSVKEEIARLNSLVNNVLRFGRPARLTLKRTRLATILENVRTLVHPQAQEQNVQVELQDLTQGAEIMVDAELLNSCFSNLAINAIQAMPQGGELSLTISREDDTQVVQVRDTGEGIPRDKLDQIFEPYYSTKETGIGLGLAVTRKLIEEHHGKITVQSQVGQGTTFMVRLPEEPSRFESSAPDRSQPSVI